MGFFKSQNNYESPLGILSLKFKIGEGAFGVVYRGHFLRNNIECAIKVLNLNNETSIKDIINEIELHDSLKHDNLIGLMGKFKINNSFYLAMEYCVCDVEEYLEKITSSQGILVFIIRDLSRALNYLHDKKIAHRDIKPSNLLLKYPETLAKLADYGISKKAINMTMRSKESKPRGKFQTIVGTPIFIAPEIAKVYSGKSSSYGFECDIWSMGLIAFEIVRAFEDYDDDKIFSILDKKVRSIKIDQKIANQKSEPLFECNQKYVKLINSMLQIDPSKRSTSKIICKKFDFPSVEKEKQIMDRIKFTLEKIQAKKSKNESNNDLSLATQYEINNFNSDSIKVFENQMKIAENIDPANDMPNQKHHTKTDDKSENIPPPILLKPKKRQKSISSDVTKIKVATEEENPNDIYSLCHNDENTRIEDYTAEVENLQQEDKLDCYTVHNKKLETNCKYDLNSVPIDSIDKEIDQDYSFQAENLEKINDLDCYTGQNRQSINSIKEDYYSAPVENIKYGIGKNYPTDKEKLYEKDFREEFDLPIEDLERFSVKENIQLHDYESELDDEILIHESYDSNDNSDENLNDVERKDLNIPRYSIFGDNIKKNSRVSRSDNDNRTKFKTPPRLSKVQSLKYATYDNGNEESSFKARNVPEARANDKLTRSSSSNDIKIELVRNNSLEQSKIVNQIRCSTPANRPRLNMIGQSNSTANNNENVRAESKFSKDIPNQLFSQQKCPNEFNKIGKADFNYIVNKSPIERPPLFEQSTNPRVKPNTFKNKELSEIDLAIGSHRFKGSVEAYCVLEVSQCCIAAVKVGEKRFFYSIFFNGRKTMEQDITKIFPKSFNKIFSGDKKTLEDGIFALYSEKSIFIITFQHSGSLVAKYFELKYPCLSIFYNFEICNNDRTFLISSSKSIVVISKNETVIKINKISLDPDNVFCDFYPVNIVTLVPVDHTKETKIIFNVKKGVKLAYIKNNSPDASHLYAAYPLSTKKIEHFVSVGPSHGTIMRIKTSKYYGEIICICSRRVLIIGENKSVKLMIEYPENIILTSIRYCMATDYFLALCKKESLVLFDTNLQFRHFNLTKLFEKSYLGSIQNLKDGFSIYCKRFEDSNEDSDIKTIIYRFKVK